VYAKTVLLDERTDQVQFGRTQAETAQEFITRRHLENVEVCSGRMASTAEEVAVVAPCLLSRHAHRILIVTPPITPAGRSPSSATVCRNMSGA